MLPEQIYFVLNSLQLDPTDGLVRRHSHVRMGRYHQVGGYSFLPFFLVKSENIF